MDYPDGPNLTKGIWVRDHPEILRELIREALDTALVSAVKGNPPAEQAGQDVIDSFFATSELVRDVDPDKPLDLELTRDVIHIDISGGSLNVEDRRLRDWPGMVDPLTTPQGSRALQTFRLASGAKVENGRLVRGNKILSDTMDRNLVFPENDWPSRLLITRSALAKHEELVYAEDPLCHHKDYRGWDLRGVHLFTATMADRTNYSDCITVSESAALKLSCYRRLSQTIVDTHPIHLLVKVGSDVKPDDVVAEIEEGIDKKGNPKVRQIRTRRLVSPARVVDLKIFETHMLGEPAQRVKIRYECTYTLTEGDKITTRHGNKGCIRIVSDRLMPEILVERRRISLAAARDLWYSVHKLTKGPQTPTGTQNQAGRKIRKKQLCASVCQLPHSDQNSSRRIQQDKAKKLDAEAHEPNGVAHQARRGEEGERPPEDPAELARQVPDVLYEAGKFWQLTWVRAEVLVHPYSIAKRRSFGLLREMMCNRLAKKRGSPVVTDHWGEAYNMRQLVAMKLGGKRKARVGGRILDYSVFAAPAYWLRLDMHAREQLAHMGNHKPLNFVGLNPDAGKVSGQRINPGVATIMHAKGLGAVHKYLHHENIENGAVQLMGDLMAVLAYSGQATRRKE